MRSDDIVKALSVGSNWTRQIKGEEKRPSARLYRDSMWATSRVSLRDLCFARMPAAWDKASGGGRLPTHWRQIFYVMRPICDDHALSDRPLRDTTFKQILEQYLDEMRPGWDVLRGARGVFKEPHAAENDSGLAMSTMNVRNYLRAARPSPDVAHVPLRFPTKGARNRIAAVLICEKEGFDELLQAEQVPARFDLALMSTKGISAVAARDLAARLGVPCFTLHDLDKNGFVMAAGFPFATDLGIRLADVDEWNLEPEDQHHPNPAATRRNLIRNGATAAEAEFIASGQRVELNMFSGPDLIAYVEGKLRDHEIGKVVPDDTVLGDAWRRAFVATSVNAFIDRIYDGDPRTSYSDVDSDQFLQDEPPVPDDLHEQVRSRLDTDPTTSWDYVVADMVAAAIDESLDDEDTDDDEEGGR